MGLGEKLEKLAKIVPGIYGYQDREKSRDTDKAVRIKLSAHLEQIKLRIEGDKRLFMERNDFSPLMALDRIASKLDKIINLIRYASQGYSGIFDISRIGQDKLNKLYAFDLGLFDDMKSIEAAAGVLRDSSGDTSSLKNAIQKLDETLDDFEKNFLTRQDLLSAE
ncbi:MAG TPA: hypothetical protein DCP92_07050 [Nitrospiraceae bacterium]|jgi:hypothetical protein|nr:hypothetical protein [Nitrospiraceae bacterium]